jgi:hypothetical protein
MFFMKRSFLISNVSTYHKGVSFIHHRIKIRDMLFRWKFLGNILARLEVLTQILRASTNQVVSIASLRGKGGIMRDPCRSNRRLRDPTCPLEIEFRNVSP